MAKDLNWAAKTLISLAGIPVQPHLIKAFSNYAANEMWVKGVIRTAAPAASSNSNPYYFQALEILKQNGIDVNIFDTN